MKTSIRSGALAAIAASALLVAAARPALAHASFRAAFVANNGNLEGSVSSYRVNNDGTLTWISKYIIGSRPNTQVYVPGTNAQAISITPNGRYLAVGHGTSASVLEQLTILQVNSDGTMSPFAIFQTPDSPLDLQWVTDEYLAVVQTLAVSNVIVYRFNPAIPSMTQVDSKSTSGFTATLALHPSRQYLFAQSTGPNAITCYSVSPAGALTVVQTLGTGNYPLGIGVSPDGARIYGGGGISGNVCVGASIDSGTGMMALLAGSPFASPGVSPKQVVVSTNGLFAYAAHGTDATCRAFAVNPATGALTATGFSFDVGFQGSLGEMAALDNLLLITDRDTISDGVMGLYSFTVNGDGSLAQNGGLIDSQGIAPTAISVWKPAPCPADLDGDGLVGSNDLALLLGGWGGAGPADLDMSGSVGSPDLALLLGAWGPCP